MASNPALRAKPQPQSSGAGELAYPGFHGEVDYVIAGDLAGLRRGKGPLRGRLRTTPETARAAFREGRAWLRLADGRERPLTMIAHTVGSDTVYFELDVEAWR
jgi:hypothetical protein